MSEELDRYAIPAYLGVHPIKGFYFDVKHNLLIKKTAKGYSAYEPDYRLDLIVDGKRNQRIVKKIMGDSAIRYAQKMLLGEDQ